MVTHAIQPRLQLKDEAATHIRELIVSGQVGLPEGARVRVEP